MALPIADFPLDLGQGIEALVALGTFALAVVTWRMATATREMASATKKMADSAEEEMKLLRRQTEATEATTEQGARRLAAESEPVINVLRAEQNEAAGAGFSDNDWMVSLRNDGPVAATIKTAKVNTAPQPIPLTAMPAGPIQPQAIIVLSGTTSPGLMQQMNAGNVPAELSYTYESVGGHRQNTQVTLRSKDGGERWIVIQDEKHKATD